MNFALPKFVNDFRASRAMKRENSAIALLGVTSPHAIKTAPVNRQREVVKAISTLNKTKPHMVRNWYESGNPYSDGSRSYVGNYSTDARYDQNPVARRTMEIRCRYWEQNSTFMKSALDVGGQYAIGTHMPVVTSLASGSDSASWRDRAEKVFHEMCGDAGLNDESMFSLMDVARRRATVDGNILAVETSKRGQMVIRRGTKYETLLDVWKPCYQLIESQRIGSPYESWTNTDTNIFDGVQFMEIESKLPNGAVRKQLVKSGYWVNDSLSMTTAEKKNVFIPVANCYYATTAHRVNEPRGVSAFYAAEPTLALLEDLLKLEMRAQEVQSDIALIITNGAGQAVSQPMQSTLAGLGVQVSTGTDGKPVVTAKDVADVKVIYDKIWGGRTAIGRTGDTLEMGEPKRPAEATRYLWNFLIDSFCSGSNVPRILVHPKDNKGQGTEVRAEIEKANAAWIKEFNLVWKPWVHRQWNYFIGWAIQNDERVKNPPADWQHIEVSPPRSVVVDLGYVSANALAEMAAGVCSLHDWAQDRGTTKQRIIQNSVSDLFDIKLACAKAAENPEYAKYGITVEAAEVRNNLSEVVKNMALQATAEAQKAVAENPPEEIAA